MEELRAFVLDDEHFEGASCRAVAAEGIDSRDQFNRFLEALRDDLCLHRVPTRAACRAMLLADSAVTEAGPGAGRAAA